MNKQTNIQMLFYYKYLKYKFKYLKLKQLKQSGNGNNTELTNPKKKFKSSDGQAKSIDTITTIQQIPQIPQTQQISQTPQTLNITNNDLFILFISSKILEKDYGQQNITTNAIITKITNDSLINTTSTYDKPQRNINKPKRYRDYESELTPLIKRYIELKHYDSNDIDNLKTLIEDALKSDTDKITNSLAKLDLIDSEYKNYENYGKLIECWIADNMKCPCCEQYSLRRYASDIMPVIDLVCINPEHNFSHGVKFYQVKASNGAPFMGSKYFDKNTQTIHVGSIRQGHLVHSIKMTDDDFNKKILIGYICIEFAEKENTLQINLKKSFIVCPKYDKTIKQLFLSDIDNSSENETTDYEFGELYYKYINSTHPIIKFSNINNQVKLLNEYIAITQIQKSYLDTNKWIQNENPLKDMIQ